MSQGDAGTFNAFIKTVHLHPFEHMDNLLRLQRATGIYANELSPNNLRDITWSNICNTTLLKQFFKNAVS